MASFTLKGSKVTIADENHLFSMPTTIADSHSSYVTEIGPSNAFESSNYIEFNINASENEFLCLSETRFALNLQMQFRYYLNLQDGEIGDINLNDKLAVAPVNLLLQSMIKSVEVSINDVNVHNTNALNPYRAYIESLLGYSKRGAETNLKTQIWELDSLEFESWDGNDNAAHNPAWYKRQKFMEENKICEMSGPLSVDLFQQGRPLLPGSKLSIRLTLNDPAFYMQTNNGNPGVRPKISKPRLFVRRFVPSTSFKLAVEKALQSKPAIYPIDRVGMKVFNLPTGTQTINFFNAVTGQMPAHITLGIVRSEAFNGDLKFNPYYFGHNKLNYLSIDIDGKTYPAKPLRPDFEQSVYLECYDTLVDSLGRQNDSDAYLQITRENYMKGFALFGIDLTPSHTAISGLSLQKQGQLTINLGFAEALKHSYHVIIRCVYANTIEIDKHRTVKFDYIL